MKTRVLYLLPTLMTGGLERMVYLLSSRIDRSRFEAEILCFELSGPFEAIAREAGLSVTVDLRRPGFLDLKFLRRLAARLREDPPDLVHAHNATALVYASFAARAAGIPVVYTEHDRSFPGTPQDRVLHFAAGRLADRVVVVAEWLRRALVRHEGFDPSRIGLVPNGIESERFAGPFDPKAVRASLDIGEDTPVVACVARLAPVKNHAALLAAWRRIVDIWPDAVLLLVGDGPGRDDVRYAAGRLSLGVRNVRFLLDRRDVPELLAASDFHVLASKSEGMSLTLLEAMAAGRASVATRVGGNPEVLEEGRTGLLVEPGDLQGLAEGMASLIQDPARARRMGASAREVFQARHTVEAMVAAYERVYADVLGERRSPVPRDESVRPGAP